MKKTLFLRAHEWAADHFTSIQYPHISPANKAPFFKHQMPFWKRYVLFVVGLILLGVSVVLALGIILIAWAAITA